MKNRKFDASPSGADESRREFLRTAGRLSIAVPPAIVLLGASRKALASHDNGNQNSQDFNNVFGGFDSAPPS